MDIEDAFTQEAIAAAGTNVEGTEEARLREIIRNIYTTNGLSKGLSEDHENIAVLCFVAGRTFQTDEVITHIPIPIEIVPEFMEFLAQRGES
jgi:hypothetical protein